MNIYIGIETQVLKETIELVLKEKNANVVILEHGDSVPKNSTIILEPSYIEHIKLPSQDDFSNIIIIGYEEEFNHLKIKNYHHNLYRPFLMSDFLALLFQDVSYGVEPLSIKLIDKIIIDKEARIVYLDNKHVKLSKNLLSLFVYLYDNYNKICSREQIMKEVYFGQINDAYTVDTYICYLKEKISKSIKYL